MKRIRAALKTLLATKVDKQVDRLHAESRAEIARAVAEGRGREGLKESAALLGLSSNGTKPKMIFGSKRASAAKRS